MLITIFYYNIIKMHPIIGKSFKLFLLLLLCTTSAHQSNAICKPFLYTDITAGSSNSMITDKGYTLKMTSSFETDAYHSFDSTKNDPQCTFINIDVSTVATNVQPYDYRFIIKNYPTAKRYGVVPTVQLVMGH